MIHSLLIFLSVSELLIFFSYAFAIHALHTIPAPELYAVPVNSTENPFKAIIEDSEEQRFFKKQKVDDAR